MDPTPAQALLRKFPAKEVYQPGRMCQCHFRAQREKIFFDPKKLKPGQTGSFLKIPNLSPSLDFEEKKKKKRKRRIFEFFSEFYLLIQGYNHIRSGFLCACDPTIKTNRSVQSKEIDVRNSHKKVAYRAPAAQLKMTSGSPQLYPMP